MAKLKLLSTIFSKLGSLTKNNGQIIVTRDSKSLYVDLEGDRIEITDWIDVNTETELLATLTPLTNKYYYTLDTNKIWRYIEGSWKDIIYINFTKETNKINFKTENPSAITVDFYNFNKYNLSENV